MTKRRSCDRIAIVDHGKLWPSILRSAESKRARIECHRGSVPERAAGLGTAAAQSERRDFHKARAPACIAFDQ